MTINELNNMDAPTGHDQNADQIAYWNGAGGQRWAARQPVQDILLQPIADLLIDRAGIRPGERVLDVGCGSGSTTFAFARAVGPSGHVMGIDISAPMLARAREVTPEGAPVEFVLADATIHSFAPENFDLLASRFGVMFFADPALSFANLRRAMRRSGRLAFACWREPRQNPLFMLPLQAVYQHVPKMPQVGPEDPGPFALASEARVHAHTQCGRLFGRRDGALRSRARCGGRRWAGCRGQERTRNRTVGPRARRSAARRHRCCGTIGPRSADAMFERQYGAARCSDLDRDGANSLNSLRHCEEWNDDPSSLAVGSQ